MQDKELDELFRSKLDDYHEQPSPRVWDAIATEVATERPARRLLPFISIAASVLVLVTAALFLLPGEGDMGPKKPQIAHVPNKTQTNSIVAPRQEAQTSAEEQSVVVKNTAQESVAATSRHQQANAIDAITKPDEAKEPVIEPQVAQVEMPKQETLIAAVPDSPVDLSPAPAMAENIEFKTQFRTNALGQVQSTRTLAAAPTKKRGLHSIGDLINVVISKVDKRKDKIIEFSNDEDDESTITGLNLGIVKIKKDQ